MCVSTKPKDTYTLRFLVLLFLNYRCLFLQVLLSAFNTFWIFGHIASFYAIDPIDQLITPLQYV